jgi:Plasmid pRiA4b ORF-3-like protein
MKTTRLRAVLCGVAPPVARVIDVPADSTLPELHDLLQAAIGWTNSHLHQFVTPEATYGMDLDEGWPQDQRDETSGHLADLGNRFEYIYDFGDGWTHDVEVVAPGGGAPGCLDGYGACPPEDCGGPGGYAELLDTLADPSNPDHDEMRSWVGNRLRQFDVAATDQRVRRTAGQVPESARLLMDLIGDGIKLTPGGRLPRTVVRSMQQHRTDWYPLDRPASIEDDLWPLVALHDLLRRVGLLRLRNGVLTRTRAAGDDLAIIRRLRSAFEPNDFGTAITELTIGVLGAEGPLPIAQLAMRVHQMLGGGWQLDGQPLTEEDLQIVIGRQSSIMRGLDLIDGSNWRVWSIGASGLSLLPRASMLAEI